MNKTAYPYRNNKEKEIIINILGCFYKAIAFDEIKKIDFKVSKDNKKYTMKMEFRN
jgi:hypothetical protein